jgi:uncharacterized membrane protein YgcG
MTSVRRLLALLCAAATLAAAARPAGAQTVPPALIPPSPAPGGFIADGGPVLTPAARAALDARIAEVQRATGGDVAVAVLRDVGGRAPSDVGLAIYRAWKVGAVDTIGSARRDLGALLLLVPKELAPSGRGECWITTGLGAEGTLTDARAARICRDEIVPHLRRRDHAAAIAAGVDAIGASLARATGTTWPPDDSGAVAAGAGAQVAAADTIDDPTLDEPAADGSADDGPGVPRRVVGGLLAAVAVVGGYAGVARARRRRPRPCPAGHGPMTRLDEIADDAALTPGQQAEERLRSVDYDVWACEQCPERIVVGYGGWLSAYDRCPQCGARTVERTTRTLVAATTSRSGLAEITSWCHHCAWRDVGRRTIPRRSSSGGGSGGGGSSRSFGGSGRSAGGGGGSSY